MLAVPLTFCPLASGDKIENGHLNLKVKLCVLEHILMFLILMAFIKTEKSSMLLVW